MEVATCVPTVSEAMHALGQELKCSVCLELVQAPCARIVPCTHTFCKTCVSKWLTWKPSCPLCKTPATRRDLQEDTRTDRLVAAYTALERSFGVKFFTMTQTQQRQQREEEEEKIAEKRMMDWLPTPGGNGGSAPKHMTTPDANPAHLAATMTNNNTDGIFSQDEESLSENEQQNVRTVLDYKDDAVTGPRDNANTSEGAMDLYGDVGKVLCDIDNVLKRQRDDDDDDDLEVTEWNDRENLCGARNSDAACTKPVGITGATNRNAPAQPEMTEMDRAFATATCAFCGKTEVECSAGRMIAVPVEKKSRKKKKKVTKPTKATGMLSTSAAASVDGHETQPEQEQEQEEKCIYVHEMCALFSPNCYEDAAGNIMNVEKELRRSKMLKCHICGGMHASLGCYKESCKKSFHYPCAMTSSRVLVDAVNFAVACTEHRKALPGRGNVALTASQYASPCPPQQKAAAAAVVELKHRDDKAAARKQRVTAARDIHSDATTHTDRRASGADDDRIARAPLNDASKRNPWAGIVFATSGLDKSQRQSVDRLARLTNVSVTSSILDATHLIVGIDAARRVKRTAKYLSAIVCGATVLGVDWVDDTLLASGGDGMPPMLECGKYTIVGDTQGGRFHQRAAGKIAQPFASADVAILPLTSTFMPQNSDNLYNTIKSLLVDGGACVVSKIDESTKCLIADGMNWPTELNDAEDVDADGAQGKIPVVSVNWVMDQVGSLHAQLFDKNVITRISRAHAMALMAP